MKTLMPICLAFIAAAALASAAAADPEQAKPAPEASQSGDHPITVLASADHIRAPASSQPAEEPRKPRAMRVTTCRCGDQAVEPADEPKDR